MSIFIVGFFVVIGFVVFVLIAKNDLGIDSLQDEVKKPSNVEFSKGIYSSERSITEDALELAAQEQEVDLPSD